MRKTSNFGNADVSIIGGFFAKPRFPGFLKKKLVFPHFSSMIFAEQVKKTIIVF